MQRRRFSLFLALTCGSSVVAIVAACSAPEPQNKNPIEYRDDETGKKDAGTTKRDAAPKPEEDPPLPDGGKPPGRVYAHTAKTLYLFEPLGQTLTKIGPFACLNPSDRMLDLALDRDGVMYGTSDDGFLKIDPVDASCSYVKEDRAAQYPNSLAFVPIGTVDNTKEVLVGYRYDPNATNQATVYAKIELDGTMVNIGTLNDPAAPIKYRSSGDIMSMIRNGNKAYLTVKPIATDAGTGNDLLAEVDPKTGRIIKIVGDVSHKNLYGLAQWAGTAYGFDESGNIIEINMQTGVGTTLTTLTEEGTPVAWYGAGVTTDAPTKP
ncbi:MAG: hypothetical protein KF764_00990 [Labilithrix sp.]|nr:hypothetical protein [Labilithrix sp.]MBX3225553.1 hypothetical protein [Labilithrix sp.]